MGISCRVSRGDSTLAIRIDRVARIACLLALSSTSIAATTAATAYQDFAGYSGVYVGAQERWRAHLVEVPVGSSYDKAANASTVSPVSLKYGLALRSAGDIDMLRGDAAPVLPTVTLKGDRPFKPVTRSARQLALLDTEILGISADAKPLGMPRVFGAEERRKAVAATLENGIIAKAHAAKLAAKRKPGTGRISVTLTPGKAAASIENHNPVGVRGTLTAYAPTDESDANDPFGAVLTPPVVVPPSAVPKLGDTKGTGRPSARPAYDAKKEAAKKAKRAVTARIVLNRGDHAWAAKALPASQFSKKARKCLAEGIYFEARGESKHGQKAVAQVIVNRVKNPVFPNSICGVVYHNKHMRNRCQFSFACDGIRDRVRSKKAWRVATTIANKVIDGKVWLKEVGSASHYHADYVRPRWARKMKKMSKIGKHIFFRTKNGGWG